MKQILQDRQRQDHRRQPRRPPSAIPLHTTVSLISAGTERMLVDFGRASIDRRQQDKVRQVLASYPTDGLSPALEAVRSSSLSRCRWAHCNVGVVTEVGAGVRGVHGG